MESTMRMFRLVVVAVVLASASPAQTVWSMGAPWTDLAAVITAAAPGDIVLLNGMTFPPFTLTKGLTIVGPGVIQATMPLVPQYTVLTIPPAQHGHVVDVDFPPFVYPHGVRATGTVTFEDCTFCVGVPDSLAINGTILLHRCTFVPAPAGTGPSPAGGLRMQGGVCWITNSTLVGGPGHFYGVGIPSYGIPPTPALLVQSGTVCVSNSTLTGGQGYVPGIFGSPVPGERALVVLGGSVSITDCTLTGGSSPSGLPGPDAVMASPGTVSYARSTFTGGAGTPPGQPGTGQVQHVPEFVGMAIAQPFRLGLSTQLIATAGTAQPLGMVAAFDPASATHPIVLGPFLATPLVPLLVAMPQPGAQVVRTISVPNQATLLGFELYAQAFQLAGAFVHVSAAVGGVVH